MQYIINLNELIVNNTKGIKNIEYLIYSMYKLTHLNFKNEY